MKMKYILFFPCIVVVIFLYGCKKEFSPIIGSGNNGGGDSVAVVHDTDVYLSGMIWHPGANNVIAVYWKNGVPQLLFNEDSTIAIANSLAVSGNNIYVTGNILYEKVSANNFSEALYWMNGQALQLQGNGDTCLYANAVASSGSDVYICGGSGIFDWQESPCYWKNGISKLLSTPGNSPGYSAVDIAVSGNDVYIAGTDQEGSAYWKNGVRVALQMNAYKEDDAYPTAIAVSGNDVYVAGNSSVSSGPEGVTNIDQRACYWKNGVQYELKDTGNFNDEYDILYASSIAISGDDVYIGGLYNNHAIYWKNNAIPVIVGVTLQNWSGLHVTSSGNDIYFAAELLNSQGNFTPNYWKLGETPIQCNNMPYGNSFVNSITVIEK